ncbi:MAG: hypothetical protein ABIN18_29700 [Pseudomonadota bacterium]
MTAEKITVISEKENDREPHTSPEICVYGALEKLTQMPGGSLQTEGLSGKIHKKDRPNYNPPRR